MQGPTSRYDAIPVPMATYTNRKQILLMSSVTLPVVAPDGLKALIKLPNKILHARTRVSLFYWAPNKVGICQPTLEDSVHQEEKLAQFKTI